MSKIIYHNILPLDIGLNKVGLPLIVTSSEPHLCFIIDTGATHNIVFSFVYEQFPAYFLPLDPRFELIGIDGGAKKDVPQVTARLSIEDKSSDVTFSVLDATETTSKIQKESGVQIHGILGIPFLIENKWILDFNELQIKAKD